MVEFTDEERRIISEYNEMLLDNPYSCSREGLIQLYYQNYDRRNEEFERVMYSYTKRILVEVARKRGLEVDSEASFDILDIVPNDGKIDDLDVSLYGDGEALTNYLEEKTAGIDAEESEQLLSNIGTIQDGISDFMRDYIPKILESFQDLSEELEDREEEKFDAEEVESDDSEVDDDDFWGNGDMFEWDESDDWGMVLPDFTAPEKERITDDELLTFIKFLNSYSTIKTCKNNGLKGLKKLKEISTRKKLEEFYSNKDFSENFSKIMEHDRTRHTYLFHGTQGLESAESITREGLGMMRDDLTTTTYEEFTMDQVLLYHRGGFMAQIGDDAVVIIDQPKDEDGKPINIVRKIGDNEHISFTPSGLQGLDGRPEYIIDPKYIVGYVDKRNKKIVFNPEYYDYERFELDNSEPHQPSIERKSDMDR